MDAFIGLPRALPHTADLQGTVQAAVCSYNRRGSFTSKANTCADTIEVSLHGLQISRSCVSKVRRTDMIAAMCFGKRGEGRHELPGSGGLGAAQRRKRAGSVS